MLEMDFLLGQPCCRHAELNLPSGVRREGETGAALLPLPGSSLCSAEAHPENHLRSYWRESSGGLRG